MKRALAPLAILGLALTGCGGTSEAGTPTKHDVMEANCDMLASYSKSGDLDKRNQIVDATGDNIKHGPQRLQDAHDGLVNTVDGAKSSWMLAVDSYAQTCFDLGWEG